IRSTFFIPHPRFLTIAESGNSRAGAVESQSYNSYDKITIYDTITKAWELDNRSLGYARFQRALLCPMKHAGSIGSRKQTDGHKSTGSISGSGEREEFFARGGS